jgi:hypothetical protein
MANTSISIGSDKSAVEHPPQIGKLTPHNPVLNIDPI